MATHSSILAWKIPWTEEPGRLQSMGLRESGMTEQAQREISKTGRQIQKSSQNKAQTEKDV